MSVDREGTAMNRLISFVTIIFILAGAYVYYFPWATLRFKMTAEFETPQGLRTGSGLVEATYGIQFNPVGGDVPLILRTFTVRGDAIAVEIPNASPVYVTLRPVSHQNLGAELLDAVGEKPTKSGRDWIAELQSLSGVGRITPKSAPLLVTFRDPRDETSGRGSLPTDEISPGVRLRGIRVEVTNEPISRNIQRHLPWLTSEPYRVAPNISIRFATGRFEIVHSDLRK